MKENRKSIRDKVSARHVCFLCIITSTVTFFLLFHYGSLGHSVLSSSYNLKKHVENISNDGNAKEIIKQNKNLQNLINDLPVIIEIFDQAGGKLTDNILFYRITGIISLILAVLTCFLKPTWIGLISIPMGVSAFLWGSF